MSNEEDNISVSNAGIVKEDDDSRTADDVRGSVAPDSGSSAQDVIDRSRQEVDNRILKEVNPTGQGNAVEKGRDEINITYSGIMKEDGDGAEQLAEAIGQQVGKQIEDALPRSDSRGGRSGSRRERDRVSKSVEKNTRRVDDLISVLLEGERNDVDERKRAVEKYVKAYLREGGDLDATLDDLLAFAQEKAEV